LESSNNAKFGSTIYGRRDLNLSQLLTDSNWSFTSLKIARCLSTGWGRVLSNDEGVGLAAQLYVVVGELAELGIVQAGGLVVLGGAEGETWDQVHEEQDQASTDEGVGETRNGIGELVSELDVVLVEPSTGNNAETIEMCYVITFGTVSSCLCQENFALGGFGE
jgi:hypothetical protein